MDEFVTGSYMVSSVLFILSLGGLANQETAKRGNLYGVLAMLLAIVAAFFEDDFNDHYELFLPAFFAGGLIGGVLALRVSMISMPQLVAALHSFVGLAATLVTFSHFILHDNQSALEIIETNLGVFIGAATFTGSVVAYGKLQGVIRSSPLIILGWFRHVINISCILSCIGLAIVYSAYTDVLTKFWILLGSAGISGFLGWHLVMAIGGADMPVVVSMLNSYSGWATVASGFLLENELLIITGALVGSSGAILSYVMCKYMNRSFFNVIAGGFGGGTPMAKSGGAGGEMKEVDTQQMVKLLSQSKSIIIVPGYGMAVAKAQHYVAEMVDYLKKQGKKVQFCIHPVAGRLPGHMNVLLAEANVDYKIVKELDEINSEFPNTDLAMVIGANDIVNPDAEDPSSPIAGMPVCEVWKSKTAVVFKRGAGAGYAGIENPLFTRPNTRMFYGSADASVKKILNELTSKGEEAKNLEEIKGKEPEEEVTTIEEEIPEPKMSIGIPKEVYPREKRVGMTPSTVKKFRKLGFKVNIESGAGVGAAYSDEAYKRAGAEIMSARDVWKSNIVLKVRKPDLNSELNIQEDSLLEHTKLLVSYIYPAQNVDWLNSLAKRYPDLTVLAMDCVPRITRAQKLDSLSSMANISGYRAVMEAFQYFQRCPKPMITAAGKMPPANVLVIGAGVAGLAAIGYCKNLGCVVKAIDTRPAAREQAESMGAEFLTVPIQEEGTGIGGYAKEMSDSYKKSQYELTKKTAMEVDIVITTALIPGRPAPKLLDESIISSMKPGSVIVDMAAEMGGNTSLTRPDEVYVTENSIRIVGFSDLASRMAPQSSELYSNNLWHLMDEMGGAEKFHVNPEDEIISGMLVVNQGEMTWKPLEARQPPQQPSQQPPQQAPQQPAQPADRPSVREKKEKPSWLANMDWLFLSILLTGLFVGLSYATYSSFMTLFMTFVLAVFIGYMVIWNVNPALHTPLMSVTNAICGVIVIGAMLLLDSEDNWIDEGSGIAWAAVFLASINIWGGFIVTQRMLNMFRTKE